MQPSKEDDKYGRIRQVVVQFRSSLFQEHKAFSSEIQIIESPDHFESAL